jgi:hypothetical protein
VYDLIAGTAVVYAWDARAARLRFLARQAEPIADAAAQIPAPAGAHDGPGTPQAGPDALAEPGPQEPEPSSKGDAWPAAER